VDIREAINAIVGNQPMPVVVGTVTATDGTTADIQPLDETAAPLLGIDLSVGDTAAISYRPEVGATVLVLLDSATTGFVIAASRGKVVMNGGDNGALINIDALVQKINAIEDDLNTLRAAFKNWVVAPQDGGAALKTAAANWTATDITKTASADIADNNITH